MYKNTNCFHLAVPCGDLEIAKKFYNEALGCRLDNSAQEWADVDFWVMNLLFMLVIIS
jgi:extradiol dioxygenase family protein